MNIYRVTFIGHREINNYYKVEERLDDIIFNLLRQKEYVEFYIGNNGDFDIMATSSIRRAIKKFGNHNSALNLVLPYKIANMDLLSSQFDDIIIPDIVHKAHPKKAITLRNHWMVDNSDILICYIERLSGGAADTFKYANKNNNIKILNIAESI